MSKFKAKDLHFDAEEPAFLRRLRGQARGEQEASGWDPDRHIDPSALPKKPKRLESNDEDDAPTYVVEGTGETVTTEEYEKMVKGGDGDDTVESEGSKLEEEGNRAPKKVAEVGVGAGSRKRKALKVGEEADGDNQEYEDSENIKKPLSKKPKKKTKAIKLSFGDDEDT